MLDRRIQTGYEPVLNKIEELQKKNTPCIIAIDGMCGSGKSYLADLLGEHFDCNIFRMDEFFLPLEMKKEERLAIPGGNVHYERFKEELLDDLIHQRTVTYRPYLCGLWRLGDPIKVEPKQLNIVEGTYCLHPELRSAYGLKIFLSVDEQVQLERIRQRSGEEKLKQFINRWIPLENLYFNELNIKDLCDITLDTTHY